MVFKLKKSGTNTDTPDTTDPGNTGDEDIKDVLIGDVDRNNIVDIRDATFYRFTLPISKIKMAVL